MHASFALLALAASALGASAPAAPASPTEQITALVKSAYANNLKAPASCTFVASQFPQHYTCPLVGNQYMTWREVKSLYKSLANKFRYPFTVRSWTHDGELVAWTAQPDAEYWTVEYGDNCPREIGILPIGQLCLPARLKPAFHDAMHCLAPLAFLLATALAAPASTPAATPASKTDAVAAVAAVYDAYVQGSYAAVPPSCTVTLASPKRFLCKTTVDPLALSWQDFKATYDELRAKYSGRLSGYSWAADGRLVGDWDVVESAASWTLEFGDECLRKGAPSSGHRCLVVGVHNTQNVQGA